MWKRLWLFIVVNNNKKLSFSFVSRCSHVWCRSRRFDLIVWKRLAVCSNFTQRRFKWLSFSYDNRRWRGWSMFKFWIAMWLFTEKIIRINSSSPSIIVRKAEPFEASLSEITFGLRLLMEERESSFLLLTVP